MTALLLKGGLGNFLHSLDDYLRRRSLAAKYPRGVFLWGAWRRSSLYEEGAKALLYISRNEYNGGGVALYGVLMEPEFLEERYWPEGDYPILLPIKTIKFARGVLENPDDPSRWKLVEYATLKRLGVILRPGPQRVDDRIAEKIVEIM